MLVQWLKLALDDVWASSGQGKASTSGGCTCLIDMVRLYLLHTSGAFGFRSSASSLTTHSCAASSQRCSPPLSMQQPWPAPATNCSACQKQVLKPSGLDPTVFLSFSPILSQAAPRTWCSTWPCLLAHALFYAHVVAVGAVLAAWGPDKTASAAQLAVAVALKGAWIQ